MHTVVSSDAASRPKSMPGNPRIATESWRASSTAGFDRLNHCCRKYTLSMRSSYSGGPSGWSKRPPDKLDGDTSFDSGIQSVARAGLVTRRTFRVQRRMRPDYRQNPRAPFLRIGSSPCVSCPENVIHAKCVKRELVDL